MLMPIGGNQLPISAARWQGWSLPDMFFKFYLVKNHKIANNSGITETTEKISTHLESLEFILMYV
jgi:hypothetical protein